MARRQSEGLSDHGKAARHRMDDARALFNAGRWRSAMYLAGYSIECLLKSKLTRLFMCTNLHALEKELRRRGALSGDGTVFSHQLEDLLRMTQGWDRLRQNLTLCRSFGIINNWMPAWRYSSDLSSRETADDFLVAIERIAHWIETNVCWRDVIMANLALKRKIRKALRESCFNDPEDRVAVSNGSEDFIHIAVVSRKFDGPRLKKRNDMIWSVLVEKLRPEEWGTVSLSVGTTPDEPPDI